MRHVAREHPHVALVDVDEGRAVVGLHVDMHASLDLEEDLLVGVDMEVGALVRAADDHDDEVAAAGEHLPVADWRFQRWAVLGEPLGKVDRLLHQGLLSAAVACISISRCGWGSSRTATVVRAGPVSSKYSAQ